MKMRKFYLFAATALVLASCSSSDELGGTTSSSKKAIKFAAPFVGKTRATGDLDVNSIQNAKISVWGDQYVNSWDETDKKDVFNNHVATLSYDATSASWNLNKIAFWEDGYKYDFAAVAPAPAETGFKAEYTDGLVTISDIPVVQTIGNGSTSSDADASAVTKSGDDILVAMKTGQSATTENDGVQLSFRHILSRFSIYAYTSMTEAKPAESSDAEGSTTTTTTKPVTITKLTLYMPKATATYKQNSHNEGAVSGSDTWIWNGFTNSTTASSAEDVKGTYDAYEVITNANKMSVPYNTSAANVLNEIKQNDKKASYLCPMEFFVAPTALTETTPTTENLQLYMDITYEMDGLHEEKFVPVQDLHAFKQGYQTNLFISIENKPQQPVRFTNFSVNGWIDSNSNTTVIQ